ncbi:MAG: dihydroorotate dehydrogenase electron transfer subunit [Planctomycetota bacterium]|nr:dihydroorotate dehydrogenase electron transfer subunit [Planctomycetota bacterium]
MRAKKIDCAARVIANREIAPGFWRMALEAPLLGQRMRPGQFFQLRIHPESEYPFLRRPFSPSAISAQGIAFVYAVVGTGTRAMTALSRGSAVAVLGPLGNGYRLPPRRSRALLVGGGCGAPSLRPLAEILVRRGSEVFTIIGARTACALLEHYSLRRLSARLMLATDDGSAGYKGDAVAAARALLAEIGQRPKPAIYACGPYSMLKALATLAEEKGLRCQVSLEERMACGFGACLGCAVAVKSGGAGILVYRRVCCEGPVFAADEILWQ